MAVNANGVAVLCVRYRCPVKKIRPVRLNQEAYLKGPLGRYRAERPGSLGPKLFRS